MHAGIQPPGADTPRADTPPSKEADPAAADTPPQSRHPPGSSACWEIRATIAGCTHPTGMHTCYV